MVHGRVVPWSDPDELKELKEWFYNKTDRERAISKVKSYQSKGSQYLPHVIDSTSQITSAILLDETDNNIGTNAIRMAYTMALIRFVNGILDPSQRSQYAIPLHTLARKVGLSSWFVDLRHWGTHERELPSLDMLRITAKEALVWLWDHYWNNDTLEELLSDEEDEEQEENKNQENLKKQLLHWPGLLYDFFNNKAVWENDHKSLISSSNFSVEKPNNSKRTVEDKINDYISEWKILWRDYPDDFEFVTLVMERYNSLLLHILMIKLNNFDLSFFKWLLFCYNKQISIRDEKDNNNNHPGSSTLGKYFRKWDDLETKLVKRVINHINIRTVILKWSEWSNVLEEHPSYLSTTISGVLYKKMEHVANGNSDWRKKKKRKHIAGDQETIESVRNMHNTFLKTCNIAEKKIYEQSFKTTNSTEKAPLDDNKNGIVTNDILGDLANLKRRMEEGSDTHNKSNKNAVKPVDENTKDIKLWETASQWTPKPFGVL